MDDDSDYGAILEVDLEYPEHLHNLHSEYPLAPEKLAITPDMLSDEQLSLLETHERQNLIDAGKNLIGPIKPNISETRKLVPDLNKLKLNRFPKMGVAGSFIH